MFDDRIQLAAGLINSAEALLITAGAGMGVDSGLPDFRGNSGFWKAYPALGASGTDFSSIANAQAFKKEPRCAWGFYGHRLALYRQTAPHLGFGILQDIAARMPHGYFVITSNVDGQFQKSGFDHSKILEIHGSIHHLQCVVCCRESVWSADYLRPLVDEDKCSWLGKLPVCQHCGGLARPNILMFDDWFWQGQRQHLQRCNWEVWDNSASKLVVIELGAGVDIPSIRRVSEMRGAPVIRINPRHSALPEGTGVNLPMGAMEALVNISNALRLGQSH